MLPRPKLNHDEVERRFLAAGYEMLSPYIGKSLRILARCGKHSFIGEVVPNNIFQGGQMQCCGREAMARKLSEQLAGAGNPFYGKHHSIEVRERLSRLRQDRPPQHLPPAARKAIGDRLRGVPRSAETREKIRVRVSERYQSLDYCARLAASGKTAGKQGIFYIVRIGALLKLGSATTTMAYRMRYLRKRHGDVELVTYCLVDDAGAYEAAAMLRCRQHWSHGEYFHDWLRLTLGS